MRTQISIVRNLASEPFPPRMKERDAMRLGAHLASFLCENFGGEDHTRNDAVARMVSSSKGLASKEERAPGYHLILFRKALIASCLHEDVWCEVMSANHLTFTLSRDFAEFEPQAEALRLFVDKISQQLAFAYDPKFGYLTTQLSLMGTGLRIRSWVHVPGLVYTQHITALCNAAEQHNVYIELNEDNSVPVGNRVIFFNRSAMDGTVCEIARNYANFMKLACLREYDARLKLSRDQPHWMHDLILKAKNITTRLMLSADELCTGLSDLRFASTTGDVYIHPFDITDPFVLDICSDEVFEQATEPMLAKVKDKVSLYKEERQHKIAQLRALWVKKFVKLTLSQNLKRRIEDDPRRDPPSCE
jgi:protein-arginine kinase